ESAVFLPFATCGDAPRTFTPPRATSGLPVSVTTTTPEVCSPGGDYGRTLTFVSAALCTLHYEQAGNDTYEAAETVPGFQRVNRANASVSVTPPSVQYSDPVPGLNVPGPVTGLIGSDKLSGALSDCSATDLVKTAAGEVASPAGSYPLVGCGGLANSNYTVSYRGALSVTPEDATLTATTPTFVSTATAASAT